MKIILGGFNAKLGRENVFKPTIGNESLHQESNDNGGRIVNLATSKNLVVKSMMFPHLNISTTGPLLMGRPTTRVITLIDRSWHSSVLGVQSFRGADFVTDHCLVVADVRERWAVIKQAAQNLCGERFNVRKLNELEVWKQYQIEITDRFAALENLKLADISGKKRRDI